MARAKKVCPACGRALLPTTAYFYRDHTRPDSLSSPCKDCQTARAAASRARLDPAERQRQWREQKRKQRCGRQS